MAHRERLKESEIASFLIEEEDEPEDGSNIETENDINEDNVQSDFEDEYIDEVINESLNDTSTTSENQRDDHRIVIPPQRVIRAPMVDHGVTDVQQPQDNPPLYPDLQPGQTRPPQPMAMSPAAVVLTPFVGPNPMGMTCSSCTAEIVTRVETSSTMKTHLIALGLCLVGCWPCACIPYCMDTCKSTNHYCPNCNSYLGTYKN